MKIRVNRTDNRTDAVVIQLWQYSFSFDPHPSGPPALLPGHVLTAPIRSMIIIAWIIVKEVALQMETHFFVNPLFLSSVFVLILGVRIQSTT